MNFFMAELRDWVKTASARDTFQGYIFNDDSHKHENGTFVTIEADDVSEHAQGLIVYVKKQIFNLWNTRKRAKQ